MNEVLMGDWVDEVWLKRNNPASPQESGLIYDSAKCHLTEMAKKCDSKFSSHRRHSRRTHQEVAAS